MLTRPPCAYTRCHIPLVTLSARARSDSPNYHCRGRGGARERDAAAAAAAPRPLRTPRVHREQQRVARRGVHSEQGRGGHGRGTSEREPHQDFGREVHRRADQLAGLEVPR